MKTVVTYIGGRTVVMYVIAVTFVSVTVFGDGYDS